MYYKWQPDTFTVGGKEDLEHFLKILQLVMQLTKQKNVAVPY